MGRCAHCGSDSRLVAEALGACGECLRAGREDVRAQARSARGRIRAEFGLPAQPPQWLTRRLTAADLEAKSAAELHLMRNEIYARRGREFQHREIRHHFYCQPWYEPNPKYSDALLSEVDRANIA